MEMDSDPFLSSNASKMLHQFSSSENSTFANLHLTDKLSILNSVGLNSCLPYGGAILSGLDNAILPFTSTNHDLSTALIYCVIHEKRSENGSVTLSTFRIAELIVNEIKIKKILFSTFSSALGISPETLSASLYKRRDWWVLSTSERWWFYCLFCWLNLPVADRREIGEMAGHNDFDMEDPPSPVETLPNLSLMSNIVLKELQNHNLDFEEFVSKVARYRDEFVIRNLLLISFPLDLLSITLKKRYGHMWYWLKQPLSERLKVFSIEFIEDNNNEVVIIEDHEDEVVEVPVAEDVTASIHFDTRQIIRRLVYTLSIEKQTMEDFSEKVLKLPAELIVSLVGNTPSWEASKTYQRIVFSYMLRHLGKLENNLSLQIDTKEVASQVVRFLNKYHIGVMAFTEKVINSHGISIFECLTSPPPWSSCSDQQQTAFIVMSFWLDQPLDKKLETFDIQTTPEEQSIVQILENIVASSKYFFSSPEDSFGSLEAFSIVSDLNKLIEEGIITLPMFSSAMGLNQSFIDDILKNPRTASKVEKYVILVANKILEAFGAKGISNYSNYNCIATDLSTSNFETSNPLLIDQTPSATPSVSPSSAHPADVNEFVKPKRTRMSDEQIREMKKFFATNPNPSKEEKIELGNLIGIPAKKVTVFFNNQRKRKARSTELAKQNLEDSNQSLLATDESSTYQEHE